MLESTLPVRVLPSPFPPRNSISSISIKNLRSRIAKPKTLISKSGKIIATVATASASSSSLSEAFNQAGGVHSLPEDDECSQSKHKNRVFFLDVNPLCYQGSKHSLQSFGHWVSLFFARVSLSDPVIAVFDGANGNEYRRLLLPSYKAHRRKFQQPTVYHKSSSSHVGRSKQVVIDVLRQCGVPVVEIEGHEADDVVATLAEQSLQRGHRVVVASPDKDFKQLISEDVQIVMPIVELDRWSFYTLKHYVAQYNCDPQSDLSFRCILGDEVDGVPGIQRLVPGFGRKTAMKLLQKHGSLENLLNAAAVRTVGREYVQEALTKYADFLRRNYDVLSLRRDVDVQFQGEWLAERDARNDSSVFSNFFGSLEDSRRLTPQKRSISQMVKR